MPLRLPLRGRWARWGFPARALAVVAVVLASHGARGDLGALVADGNAGPYRVSVLAAPVPLRVGPSQWSVLVQDAAGNPAEVAEVALDWELSSPGKHSKIRRVATPGAHPYYRSSEVVLPKAAPWRVAARIRGDAGSGQLAFDVLVAPRLGTWQSYWPALLMPALALALFFLHQCLKRREPRG